MRPSSNRPFITNLAIPDMTKPRGPAGPLRVAVVCNWGDACGIATYSSYLLDRLRPKVDAVRVFAEGPSKEQGDVVWCWERGKPMGDAVRAILAWEPSVVLIQHEYGIFPRASYLLQMLHMLGDIPHVVTMHSVYEHLDKIVCSGAMDNIIVHSASGEACLRRLGHVRQRIEVIPHGCVVFDDVKENWNITGTPYALMQFGFGFAYKGVENALYAIAKLVREQPSKYGTKSPTPLHYCYLCSENPHVKNVNGEYYGRICGLIESLGLQDHVAIIRGFQTDEVLNQYLRTYKLAIFPYVTDPKNVVYGASGAARIAIANHTPTVLSGSRMFDDFEGVLPRPSGVDDLAATIDRVFSDQKYRQDIVRRGLEYAQRYSWEATAQHYRDFLVEF